MSNRNYTKAARSARKIRPFKSRKLNSALTIVILLGIAIAWYVSQDVKEGEAPETGSTASTYSEWSTKEAFTEASKKVDSLPEVSKTKNDSKLEYDRPAQFGSAWQYDYDKSGCETRDDILKVSLEAAEMEDDCKIAAGILRYDPYTGVTSQKMSAADLSSLLDGEHIVALEDVMLSGAVLWDTEGTPKVEDKSVSDDPYERRKQIANDPLNVIMVDAGENRSKGSKDASDWLVPENPEYKCEYITRQVEVKAKYGLGVSKAEKKVMDKVLTGCVK